ncbi:MAG: hypothetical protein EBZ96_08255 [Synechococcaceae bacterium WB9_3_282]|nr:hypothetical protein [Synechococcaceae bacterium WB9_3_282]
MKEQEPSLPIKKKPNPNKKPTLIKYGSGYADQGLGGSKIRTVYKDWDESYEKGTEDAGSTKIPTKQDQKNLEYMKQVFLAGKNIEKFEDFIEFVNHLS